MRSVQDEGPGNGDSLSLPPGKLTGVAVAGARVQLNRFHRLNHGLVQGAGIKFGVDPQPLGDNLAD